MPRKLSLASARRIAIAAAGLSGSRPASVGSAAMRRVIARLGAVQIDSVNVFERSHYLVFFSRLGPYDKAVLDHLIGHDGRRSLGGYTEESAHEAAIIPVADWPLWSWRRATPERPSTQKWAAERQSLLAEVLAEFRERGALRVRELEHPDNVSLGGGWWNKNDVHWATSLLSRRGELVTVGRERFERIYLPVDQTPALAASAEVPRREAVRELVRRSAVAQGVAALDDLADYPRLKAAEVKEAVDDLVEEGVLQSVEVEGFGRPAWMAAGAAVPRSVNATALLSPFDPLVWHRPRAERLFGFHYRISIYTPQAQREHGYYVLPVLMDDQLVGRVDLKSDRKAGVLRVQHAHIEPEFAGAAGMLAKRLASCLEEAAAWQGLSDISLTGPGTWIPALDRALG